MTPEATVDLMREAIMVLLMLSTVLILPGLVVGVLISIFQAATQISEQSLSFVPRLIATFLTIMISSPWVARVLTDFTHHLYDSIPGLIS
jgi:flagellar biosynthetic protein FliQ